MGRIKVKINDHESFVISKSYDEMLSAKNILIKSIFNDILNRDEELFIQIYEEYKNRVIWFYESLSQFIDEENSIEDWRLDLSNREIILSINNKSEFDINKFIDNNLKLNDKYKYEINKILEGEMKV